MNSPNPQSNQQHHSHSSSSHQQHTNPRPTWFRKIRQTLAQAWRRLVGRVFANRPAHSLTPKQQLPTSYHPRYRPNPLLRAAAARRAGHWSKPVQSPAPPQAPSSIVPALDEGASPEPVFTPDSLEVEDRATAINIEAIGSSHEQPVSSFNAEEPDGLDVILSTEYVDSTDHQTHSHPVAEESEVEPDLELTPNGDAGDADDETQEIDAIYRDAQVNDHVEETGDLFDDEGSARLKIYPPITDLAKDETDEIDAILVDNHPIEQAAQPVARPQSVESPTTPVEKASSTAVRAAPPPNALRPGMSEAIMKAEHEDVDSRETYKNFLAADIPTWLQAGQSLEYLNIALYEILSYIPLPAPPVHQSRFLNEQGLIQLAAFWDEWIVTLDERQNEVLFDLYGVFGSDPLTLQEIGDSNGLTRERVRQIREHALRHLRESTTRLESDLSLLALLSDSVKGANGLLTLAEWEHYLDEHSVWEAEKPRPRFLQLLCAVSSDHTYDTRYHVAYAGPKRLRLEDIHVRLKRALKGHRSGLPAETLIDKITNSLPKYTVPMLGDAAFLRKAISVFDEIHITKDGHCRLQRYAPTQTQAVATHWLGTPGTQLFEWEKELRTRLEGAAWVGQIRLSEAEFNTLCTIVQTESRARHYFTKEMVGQPRIVPAAVFVTTMVFAARYSQQDADEFWTPYLHAVWNVEYTQAFMTRCRKRFNSAAAELEQVFGLAFPRSSGGEVVAPIYRHALVPRYVQNDFAAWIRSKWRDILPLADTSSLLIPAMQQEPTLVNLPQRLQTFILSKNSRETAADLIADMAAAISLHINHGETVENIAEKLSATPIKQELWREIANEFVQTNNTTQPSLRLVKPRVQWVWDMDAGELALRVQNVVLAEAREWTGEPDRFVWLEAGQDDPTQADIEVEVTPWRMENGERVIQEVLFAQPDGPLAGELVLLTDMDEKLLTLPVPPHPSDAIQFFRPTKQNTLGIPVTSGEVNDGTWLICAGAPLRISDAEDDSIEPDRHLAAPYPLDSIYAWAAQFTLMSPVTFYTADSREPLLTLKGRSEQEPTATVPTLYGDTRIEGLAKQFENTFADTAIELTFSEGGKRLSTQASLWIQGQDGWQWFGSYHSLIANDQAILEGDTLTVKLKTVLPSNANTYALDIRVSLQSLLPEPIHFTVVPHLHLEFLEQRQMYSPANPFSVLLAGVDEQNIVRRLDITINRRVDDSLHISWSDLRNDPHLLLRFDSVEIPLAWSIARGTAWLEPTPQSPFLTSDELRNTTLHVATKGFLVDEFTLTVTEGALRRYPLRRGRSTVEIGKDQLDAMVRLAGRPHVSISISIGSEMWTLCHIRQRPELPGLSVTYDNATACIRLTTGLHQDWLGDCRFLAESRSNPFAPHKEIGHTDRLTNTHVLPAELTAGTYHLIVELDGVPLPLDAYKVGFEVGEQAQSDEQSSTLINEIRSGQLISGEQAQDFALLWAELAEAGKAELTPSTLFQLATLPKRVLENFEARHLEPLWPVLASIREAQQQETWIHKNGMLPSWVLLPWPILFRRYRRGAHDLLVYPLIAINSGGAGKGYANWSISGEQVQVIVYWQRMDSRRIRLRVGLPTASLETWEKITIEDTNSVYYCNYCDKFECEVEKPELSPVKTQRHRHGQDNTRIKNITSTKSEDFEPLIANEIVPQRGQSLNNSPTSLDIPYLRTNEYFPEPRVLGFPPKLSTSSQRAFSSLHAGTLRYAESCLDEYSWAAAARLMHHWKKNNTISELGLASFTVSMLLRTAAYYPHRYKRLLQQSALTPLTLQELLFELNDIAAAHVQWGMTWAELLMLHCPGIARR